MSDKPAQGTRTGHRRATGLACVGVLLLLLAPSAPLMAQYPGEPYWSVYGDVGGLFGGRWLDGGSSPSVSSRTGASVSLGLDRVNARRVAVGVAVRVGSQPLQLRERETRWSGGTLTDTRLMGTVTLPVDRSDRRRADLEIGGGFAVLSGARELFPLSAAGRVAPAFETALLLFRSRLLRDDRGIQPIGLFLRYDVLRLDPTPADASLSGATTATAGWVGRFALGVRLHRGQNR